MDKQQRRELYSGYVEKQQLPLFYQPWYLDEVCTEGTWDVSLVIRDHQVIAVWPYYLKKKYGISYITTPALTAYLGPYYHVPTKLKKSASIQKYHKKILSALASDLPTSQLIDTRWLPEMVDWMPLTWSGYKQSSRYTYMLDLTQSEEALFLALTDSQRNTIKKSLIAYDVSNSKGTDEFWKLNKATFARQQLSIPYTESYFKSLCTTLQKHGAAEFWIASNVHGSQGGACVTYDDDTAYLIATGRAEGEGAVSAAIWSAILAAKKRGCKTFDFEGSMIEGVSSYFRSFGGELTPYHRVTKVSNKVWEIVFRILNRF